MISQDDVKDVIAENVQRLLDEQGHTAYWLAKRLGVFPSRVQKLLDRENVVGADFLANIAEVFGVTANDLLAAPKKTSKKFRNSAKTA